MTIALPAAAQDLTVTEEIIMVGGIDTAHVEYIADPVLIEAIDAPIVFEDATTTQPDSSAPAADLDDSVETQ